MASKVNDKSGLFYSMVRKEVQNRNLVKNLETVTMVDLYPDEKIMVFCTLGSSKQIVIPKNSPFTVGISENGKYLYVNGEIVAHGFYPHTFNDNHISRVRNFITTLLHYGE